MIGRERTVLDPNEEGTAQVMSRQIPAADDFRYDLDLVNRDFRGLLSSYRGFEQRLNDNCVSLFIRTLEARGGVPKGKIVLIDDRPYEIATEFSRLSRELRISLLPRFDTKSAMVDSSAKIDHFGLIRIVTISWTQTLRKRNESIVNIIHQHVLAAYISLEVLFLSKYTELDRSLFKNLYELLSIGILKANRSDLLNQCWLSVTKLKSLRFRYHFTHERIKSIVAQFKRTQIEQFGPFELMVCLLSEEVPDSLFSAGIKADQGFVTFPFANLVTISENTEFWTAESKLFGDTELSAREICTCDDYSLQINCPARAVPDLEKLIEAGRPELAEQFKTNLKDYKVINRALDQLSKPLRDAGAYAIVRDFVAEVISRTVGRMISPEP